MAGGRLRGERQQRRWRLRTSGCAGALSSSSYPLLIQRVLENRGVATVAAAQVFFEGGAEIDPWTLPDVQAAAERLAQAARSHESVAVFSDFDVDGVTAGAILSEALQTLGAHAVTYIPDRFTEGYGLNCAAISRLSEAGARLLVAVDCGTGSVREVAHARSLGMDVIIIDHHLPLAELPEAQALVNPKAVGESRGAELAAAGLAYCAANALYDRLNRPFPVQRYLDLAALGTVVDMAPLVDANREIVRRGLEAIGGTERPGLQALIEVSRVPVVDTEALSFALGPRLNAPGRIAHARLSLDLLTCREPQEAWRMARELDALNQQRQRQQAEALELAWSLRGEGERSLPLLMAGDWAIPAGVAGLVASKMSEETYRPCVVYSQDGAVSRASARSIPEFDIAAALRECDGLFERYGGHHQAAGFTASNERLPEIRERLLACAEERLAGAELTPAIDIDAEVGLREIGGEEIRWLMRLGPHGEGNREPVFLSRRASVAERRTLGADGQHLWLKLRDGPVVWEAIGFGLGASEAGESVDMVYSLRADSRSAGALQLLIHDVATAR